MQLMVGVFLIVMGIGIAGIWTVDIVRNPDIDRSRGLLRARDGTGSVMVPHWIAEYATAAFCLVGGLGLVLGWTSTKWSWVVPLALGALSYTSLNSLGWVLADRTRASYGVPMVIGLAGALISILLLLSGSLM
jgi:hypothetical protein